MITEQVNNRIGAIYSAVQAATQIVATPAVVPVSDQVLKSSGGQDMDQAPIVAEPIATPDIKQTTSPMFPPRVQEPDVAMTEQTQPEEPQHADDGMEDGIEKTGYQ